MAKVSLPDIVMRCVICGTDMGESCYVQTNQPMDDVLDRHMHTKYPYTMWIPTVQSNMGYDLTQTNPYAIWRVCTSKRLPCKPSHPISTGTSLRATYALSGTDLRAAYA
eukprot:2631468-Rhodomonas_salina.2